MRTISPRSVTGAMAVLALSLIALPAAAQQAATPPPVTVGGVVYSQFQYDLKDSAGAGKQNQFSIKRAYVNAIGRFGSTLFTRVTLDILPTGTPATNQAFRLKYGYVAYTPEGSALTWKFGMLQTPFIEWEETLWDYRVQGTMAAERFTVPSGTPPNVNAGYLTSSDVGAGVDAKVNNDQFNGQLTVVNGEGYSGGTGDNGKDVQARASLRLMESDDATRVGGLRLTGYAGYGMPTTGGQRQRFLGMLSYRSKAVTLAGEFVATKDSTTGSGGATPAFPTVASRTGTVISAFGVFHIPSSDFALVGRVDLLDPNTGAAATNDKQTRIIAGVSCQVTPQFRLLANIDNLSYENPAATAAQIAVQSQALLQAQITF